MNAMRGALERMMNNIWYGNNNLFWCLVPVTWLVRWVVRARFLRAPVKGSTPDGVTVMVIGGLTAGGTGKTPVLIALGKWLVHQGYRVGVISRGYGGAYGAGPRWVTEVDSADLVGDEPLLIKRELATPVVVCRDRKLALAALLDEGNVDVVLSDDGLQHYAMPRDIELVVIDADRGLGNGRLLPAGPLREPISRLATIDAVLERNSDHPDRGFSYQASGAIHLASGSWINWPNCLAEWQEQSIVAITGLGQPQQFFEMLTGQGLTIVTEALNDHEAITPNHLDHLDEEVVLITAKDAVKIPQIFDPRVWVVVIEVALPSSLFARLTSLLPSEPVGEA